jgi:hypothetical protein
MKISFKTLHVLALLMCVTFSTLTGQENKGEPLKFSGSISAGYNRGFVVHADIATVNLAKESSFRLRFGAGYTVLNPGNALDARRIFINNNTNGTPEKKGGSFDIRIDFMLPRIVFGISPSYLVVGPRFSTFKGDFKYVGGNEDFEVRSHQWGIGAGFENYFKMTSKFNLVISYGLDFYAPSTLTGHDTSYSPDNDNVNPARDNKNGDVLFRYGDANRAIRQPFIMPHIMLGINFGL